MEPLSALLVAVLAAPVPLTRRPEWELPYPGVVAKASADSEIGFFTEPAAESQNPFFPLFAAFDVLDAAESLAAEVHAYRAYSDNWDGEGAQAANPTSLDAAMAFIAKIPAGLPLPRPMLSANGHSGLYWDLSGGFADISFDENGSASFFSRASDGEELYEDGLEVSSLSGDWLASRLSVLNEKTLAVS